LQSVQGAEVEEVRLGAARVRLDPSVSAQALIAGLSAAGFAAREEK